MNEKEYKFIGLNMESVSILYGIFLILWGLLVNFATASSSFTSLIPSIMGIPILFFSILAVIFSKKKKLMMHIVVFFGLITALGGLDIIRSIFSGNYLNLFWADLSKLMMLITGIFFTFLCIQSFRFARRNN
tara:strand:+ start:906 stop:1301 length:396 start_codon:yes stop_codon:yes gene_type:complete